ncbi:hypothetical protein NPX13_g4494 [Xylaria arbuscula]|uniref:Uncharacterized protein n=1 Tax=Xylaria arbuscula TaxID=114810 RepID=A0A9W8NFE9_9PEZI|nr:hypothetical protein NPX13_g4494 [Xylaria arbuscula]
MACKPSDPAQEMAGDCRPSRFVPSPPVRPKIPTQATYTTAWNSDPEQARSVLDDLQVWITSQSALLPTPTRP